MRRVPRSVLLAVGIALVGGFALLLWRGTSARDPASLVVGECFDVPAATQRIADVGSRTCGASHGGEVFHIFEADGAAGAYLADEEWETLVYPVCDPVFAAYTGTPVAERLDIGYLYFVPTPDKWAAGDRRVTCFITSLDGSPLTRSFRATP